MMRNSWVCPSRKGSASIISIRMHRLECKGFGHSPRTHALFCVCVSLVTTSSYSQETGEHGLNIKGVAVACSRV